MKTQYTTLTVLLTLSLAFLATSGRAAWFIPVTIANTGLALLAIKTWKKQRK